MGSAPRHDLKAILANLALDEKVYLNVRRHIMDTADVIYRLP